MEGAGRLFDRIPVIPGPPGVGRGVPGAQGHQQIARGTILQDNVGINDRQVEIFLRIDEHAVRRRQDAFPPGGKESALAVEDN